MNEYDVIVVGGGFAGAAAAIAAARQGCSTLLVEQSGSLGGAAVNCLVNPFMPYSTAVIEDGKKKRLNLSQGIFEEICKNLNAFRRGLTQRAISPHNAGVLEETEGSTANADPEEKCFTFHEEYLKLVLDRMTAEAGVRVLFHATLCEAHGEETLERITVITKSGKLDLRAKIFVDCTGDADLAVLSGCPWHLGRPEDQLCQPMTLCFRVANVDKKRFFSPESRKQMQEIYRRWQAEGKTSNPREDVLVFNTLVDGVIHFNSTRIVKKNPVDPFDLSWAETEGRKQVFELFVMLKEELPAFERAQLLMTAAWVGARESRMIDGEHLLTETELKDCTKFPDAIAAGNYDIDIHNPEGSGTSHYYFPDGTWYTIPFRSLIPRKKDNLLVAGRCISSTHEAQASYRVMPIVCCLGEAAGVAAAVCVRRSAAPKNAPVEEIQAILRKEGAFIGI